MKPSRIIVGAVLILACVVLYAWWASRGVVPAASGASATTIPATLPVLRLGILPEQDVYRLRRSYRTLADFLGPRMGAQVEILTLNTYEAVLKDFEEDRIDGAFLGSLVGVVAGDRYGARPIARPVLAGGVSTYCGVIFVKEESKVGDLAQLRGRKVAMLRATAAGSLFPIAAFARAKVEVTPTWLGTHDAVVDAVMDGDADAGAVKNLRLDAYLLTHPGSRVRRLATSDSVPNNALFIARHVDAATEGRLLTALLAMNETAGGSESLRAIGAERFILCDRAEFEPLDRLIESAGTAWEQVGVGGAAPRRPSTTAPSSGGVGR